MKIDFVMPWVDGSNPAWSAEKMRYDGLSSASTSNAVTRFRDWGFLRYWFRGVEKFAPWVNRIHFVTCGHLPPWLKTDHPKLNIVKHSDYIPAEYLPTFSSHTIELNLHRISGLEEHFVYFNDDVFILRPTTECDYFKQGLPRASALLAPIYPDPLLHVNATMRDMQLINRVFDKQTFMKGHLRKWYSPVYGHHLIRNLMFLPIKFIPGFYIPHIQSSFLKSTFDEVWSQYPEELASTCRHKFRDPMDVNQYLMMFWQICTGNFVPQSPYVGISLGMHLADVARCEEIIRKQKKIYLTWNDYDIYSQEEALAVQERMTAAFETLFPNRCSFESDT